MSLEHNQIRVPVLYYTGMVDDGGPAVHVYRFTDVMLQWYASEDEVKHMARLKVERGAHFKYVNAFTLQTIAQNLY